MLRLYNSLTKTNELFVSGHGCDISMYICGPTVYDSPHIGHARTYVMFDVIRRVLSDYLRYHVTYVMNITNLDDKIIARARELGVSTDAVTKKYTAEFFEDMGMLNVRHPSFVTKVTDYVGKIVDFIERLEENGFAYESEGSVYFDLEKYEKAHAYPLLKNKEGIKEGDGSTEKKNSADFVLWKKSKENEPRYPSKWGDGRPGWHIECSVMSSDVLGDSLDIHAGGIDLAFPHHENEIAQCQAYFMKGPWIKCFLHTGHLNIDGLKMSKSLKNFTTIKDILKTTTPRQLRILFLFHHWSKPMNYEPESFKFAESVEKKIFNFLSIAESMRRDALDSFRTMGDADREMLAELSSVQKAVQTALLDNVDTPAAMKSIVDMVGFANTRIKAVSGYAILMVRDYIKSIVDVFGLDEEKTQESEGEERIAQMLSGFREDVRRLAKQKESHGAFLGRCDQVREDVKDLGYVIEDSVSGSSIRRK